MESNAPRHSSSSTEPRIGRSRLEQVVRAYEARWFDALPRELLVARLLEAARCGRWARVEALGTSDQVCLGDVIPIVAEQLNADPHSREQGEEVLERLFEAHARGESPTAPARELARSTAVPLEARAFGAALLARRGDADVPRRWLELLRDPRFDAARLDGFLGARLDALARRLWRRGQGGALARLLADERLADRALRRLCAPLLDHEPPAPELAVAIVSRWFHDDLGDDRLVSMALALVAPDAEAVPDELLERAARLEYHSESAIHALVQRRKPESVAVLGDCLFAPPSEDELRASRIRRAAAAGLVRFATRHSAELLLSGSRSTDDIDLRETCRQALTLLRSELTGMSRLRSALDRCDPELRRRALELLDSADFGQYLPVLIERFGA